MLAGEKDTAVDIDKNPLAKNAFDKLRIEDQCITCFKVGTIIVPERESTYRCTVRSMCWFSAQIEINHIVNLPQEFLLSLGDVDHEAPIRCRIARREGLKIFVDFLNVE